MISAARKAGNSRIRPVEPVPGLGHPEAIREVAAAARCLMVVGLFMGICKLPADVADERRRKPGISVADSNL